MVELTVLTFSTEAQASSIGRVMTVSKSFGPTPVYWVIIASIGNSSLG
ncbi:MAG: hypothetical protein BWY83_00956 [bacterium ADurb.Bin478]|nr:MAG: hypothetical protein BWY83_00956 [bacterium ADurb.Bin478]